VSDFYRVGIIGFGHMHINHVAAVFGKHPRVRWVACADTVPAQPELREGPYTRSWNLQHALREIGVPQAYADYREMLAKERFDIIIICSENAQHPEVVEACAAAGVHVCVEKPMAASLAGALRMVRACQAAGTTMVVNWPLTWQPGARKIKELIDAGAIGRVLEIRWRGGHSGPLGPGASHAGVSETAMPLSGPERGATWWHQRAAGGGAMLDMCCYGAMASRWYLGQQAIAAQGLQANLNSTWGDADDHAVMAVRFPQALGVFEGTWIAPGVDVLGPNVRGTTGTLVAEWHDDQITVRLERGHGQSEVCPAPPLPAGRDNIAAELIHHLSTGEPVHPTLEMMLNLDAMAILDAGLRSAASGRLELVGGPTWEPGRVG
jgi:predicted dehydrogenase